MAEAQHVKVIPHNPLSPVSTAACVQLDACIPNFALQEYTGESEPPKSELLVEPLELIDGYLTVPEGPGLSIELNEDALASIGEDPKVLDTPIGFDGSVQDRVADQRSTQMERGDGIRTRDLLLGKQILYH